MNIQIQYGTAVTTLPAVPPEVLLRATATDLRLLVVLVRPDAPVAGADMDALCAALAPLVGESVVSVAASLAFWRGAGVLELSEADTPASHQPLAPVAPVAPPAPAPRKRPAEAMTHDGLPQYTSEQIADLLEARAETAAFIHECERLWGKMFNTMEVNILLGLSDYLGLDWDYIIALVAHCAKELNERGTGKSMRYVEKTASTFYNEDIRTHDALLEKFHQLEELRSMEGKLRTLFGMGERTLTPKEKKLFSTWLYEYRCTMDVIRLAYEITVDAKGSPNLNYMNSILANWNRDGLRTVAEIEDAQTTFREQRESKTRTGRKKGDLPAAKTPDGSFETEDFFAAAVRRSFGEDENPTPKEE